jgi:hypothetical protein
VKRLSDAARNVYSQFGEDGIIERVFEILGVTSRVCVEFGAWDGFHLSNTAWLWTRGWRGILIESDPEKYAALVQNVRGCECTCIHAEVGWEGERALGALLKARGLTDPIDFLSIDVDGDDYHVFAGMEDLRPRVVCCEYNPTIPARMELVPEPGNYFGCSARSLVKLAESKRYRLIAMTDTNCFFVVEEEADRFDGYETSLDALATDRHVTYLITGYDGDFVLSRRPTYGHRRPSTQAFAGDCWTPRSPESPERWSRRLSRLRDRFRRR